MPVDDSQAGADVDDERGAPEYRSGVYPRPDEPPESDDATDPTPRAGADTSAEPEVSPPAHASASDAEREPEDDVGIEAEPVAEADPAAEPAPDAGSDPAAEPAPDAGTERGYDAAADDDTDDGTDGEPALDGEPDPATEAAIEAEEAASLPAPPDAEQPYAPDDARDSDSDDGLDRIVADPDRFRERWDDIQAAFVDEPRRSVSDADGLVAEVIDEITEAFASARADLEDQWSSGGDASTEDLRLALQRYRAFFRRLLAA